MLIELLSFSSSLALKCLSLNNKPFKVRPTLIGFNPVDLKYYPFKISSDKCSGSCNVLMSYHYCVYHYCVSGYHYCTTSFNKA